MANQPEPWGIDTLLQTVEAFESKLMEARKIAPGINWFPYQSLGSLDHLDQTLTGPRRNLSAYIGTGPVLDIGCGDGEISFLLESMGCTVRAIDYSPTNANRMEGIRALSRALDSKIEIFDLDIDAKFQFAPAERFSATFLLGVLYHLKNPFGVLETLSRHSAWCFLSTRVARHTPDHALDFGLHPLAWLVDPDELNSDNTNYWIFSEPALKRLFRRTGWDVCDYASFGNCLDSDPVTAGGDERAYCLLRSRTLLPFDPAIELLSGWHEDEGSWRWTERQFSIAVAGTTENQAIELTFRLGPEISGPLTLSCFTEGQILGKQVFTGPGQHTYRTALPALARVIEFVADKAHGPREGDPRELALAVTALHLA